MRLFDFQRASSLMDQRGIDVILAHTSVNVEYLADYYCHAVFQPSWIIDDATMAYLSFVGLPKDQTKTPFHVVWSGEEGEIVAEQPWIKDRRYYGRRMPVTRGSDHIQIQHDNPVACVVDALGDRGLADGILGLEMQQMPVTVYEQLKLMLPHATFIDATAVLLELRMIKSSEEIDRMKRAIQSTERAIEVAFESVYAGMTELEFDGILRRTLGADGASYKWAHVAFGPNGATCVKPTMMRIHRGQIIRVDLGGAYENYICDMSRVAILGEPNSEIREIYDKCLRTYEGVRKEIGPGVKASDMYQIAKAAMGEGDIQLFGFFVGHGVGRDVHEPPFLMPNDDTLLEAGMVLDIEIPMRIQGIGSINIEDEVLITEAGAQDMNIMDRQLYCISA